MVLQLNDESTVEFSNILREELAVLNDYIHNVLIPAMNDDVQRNKNNRSPNKNAKNKTNDDTSDETDDEEAVEATSDEELDDKISDEEDEGFELPNGPSSDKESDDDIDETEDNDDDDDDDYVVNDEDNEDVAEVVEDEFANELAKKKIGRFGYFCFAFRRRLDYLTIFGFREEYQLTDTAARNQQSCRRHVGFRRQKSIGVHGQLKFSSTRSDKRNFRWLTAKLGTEITFFLVGRALLPLPFRRVDGSL